MSETHGFTHLTLEERRIILAGITNGSTKAAIAQTIGKDKSTVGKEIKLHRTLTHKCSLPLECSNYRKCVYENMSKSSLIGVINKDSDMLLCNQHIAIYIQLWYTIQKGGG